MRRSVRSLLCRVAIQILFLTLTCAIADHIADAPPHFTAGDWRENFILVAGIFYGAFAL